MNFTAEQWTQILTISPAAAVAIVVVVLFLRHIRSQSAEFTAHLKDRSDAFSSLVARIDESQAARDERISSAIDANTRATAEIHGVLMGRAVTSSMRAMDAATAATPSCPPASASTSSAR